MEDALSGHAGYRSAAWAAAVGPFLRPASRVEELRARLPVDVTLRLSLVFDIWATARTRPCERVPPTTG